MSFQEDWDQSKQAYQTLMSRFTAWVPAFWARVTAWRPRICPALMSRFMAWLPVFWARVTTLGPRIERRICVIWTCVCAYPRFSILVAVAAIAYVTVEFWCFWTDNHAAIRTLIFGLAAILGFGLAVWRARIADRQARAAADQVDIANRHVVVAEKGHITDLFSTAVEHLGSEVPAIRLGGVSALFRLIEDAPPEVKRNIFDLLCAFVRDPPHGQEPPDEQLRPDVQEILKNFQSPPGCYRRILDGKHHLDFNEAYLRGAGLRDADLTDAFLYNADLEGANLDDADLTGAVLSGANLTGAHLGGANLRGVDLWGTILKDADLKGVNLTGADLTNANLTGAHLTGANLTGARLTGANLTLANLTGANLTGAKLMNAKLMNAKLMNADLSFHADLTGANLTGARLKGADLTGANLTGANLTYAKLTGANLRGAHLTGANLTNADLKSASAKLGGADLKSAKLGDARNLSKEQLEEACVSDVAKQPKLPAKFKNVKLKLCPKKK